MNFFDKYKFLLFEFAYSPTLAKIVNDIQGTIFLIFVLGESKNIKDGWVSLTQSEIHDRTGLTECNQNTARKHLREMGLLEEKFEGLPRKLFYRVNTEKLAKLFDNFISQQYGDQYVSDPRNNKLAIQTYGESGLYQQVEQSQSPISQQHEDQYVSDSGGNKLVTQTYGEDGLHQWFEQSQTPIRRSRKQKKEKEEKERSKEKEEKEKNNKYINNIANENLEKKDVFLTEPYQTQIIMLLQEIGFMRKSLRSQDDRAQLREILAKCDDNIHMMISKLNKLVKEKSFRLLFNRNNHIQLSKLRERWDSLTIDVDIPEMTGWSLTNLAAHCVKHSLGNEQIMMLAKAYLYQNKFKINDFKAFLNKIQKKMDEIYYNRPSEREVKNNMGVNYAEIVKKFS